MDYGGFVVLIERMDGARPMTPDIALSKAYSAAVMQRPTEMLENWRNSDPVDPVVEQRGDLDVAIATNGGLAASADWPLMGEPEQRAKLRMVETVARYYWGNEI